MKKKCNKCLEEKEYKFFPYEATKNRYRGQCIKCYRGYNHDRENESEAKKLKEQGLRRCFDCGELKSVESFYKDYRGDISRSCNVCYKHPVPISWNKQQEIVMEKFKLGFKKCSKCKEDKSIDCFRNDKNSITGLTARCIGCLQEKRTENKSKKRDYLYKKQYGISLIDYEKMYNELGGKCQICQIHHNMLYVDHNHDTGKVRGLLCNTCNRGIGLLKDDIQVFKNAIKYLENQNTIKFLNKK